MIKLSKRLEAISSLVPNNSRVIDIGCDHGLLDIYLFENKISPKIIASDVNENALKNAKENIKKHNLHQLIETRLGNGLDILNDKDGIDTIIISGMGAHTIINILKSNINKLKNIQNIIVQSNTNIELLRKNVVRLNYFIEDELLIEDNKKTYVIIKFKKGKKKYNKTEMYFGPILLKKHTKLFQNNIKLELKKLEQLLSKIPKKRIIDRYKTIKKIRLYKKIYQK